MLCGRSLAHAQSARRSPIQPRGQQPALTREVGGSSCPSRFLTDGRMNEVYYGVRDIGMQLLQLQDVAHFTPTNFVAENDSRYNPPMNEQRPQAKGRGSQIDPPNRFGGPYHIQQLEH